MKLYYYNLPFGAQLLLWTSRVAVHGSCRTNPNKYALIDIAYNKVGILDGSLLLKNFLKPLRQSSNFKLQPICSTILVETEINLINCLTEHRNKYVNNAYFIKLWNLDDHKDLFTYHSIQLASEFKKVNLHTALCPGKYNKTFFNHEKNNHITLH